MDGTVVGALIGVSGTIIGILATTICHLVVETKRNKAENKRATYILKIETYADAIRYISLCCYSAKKLSDDERMRINKLSDELYYKFHPIFTILVSEEIRNKFNELRNRANNGEIKNEDAYQEVIKLLNYNIYNEIK